MSFCMNKMTHSSEKWVLSTFLDWLDANTETSDKIAHWGHVEVSWFKSLAESHPELKPRIDTLFERMLDLNRVFLDNNIVYPGMYDFSLKTVVKSMKSHGLINASYDELESCKNGNDSTYMIREIMSRTPSGLALTSDTGYADLLRYNEIDCRVLEEIVLAIQKK